MSSIPVLFLILVSTFAGFISSCNRRNFKSGLEDDANRRMIPVCRKQKVTGTEFFVLTEKLASVVSSLGVITSMDVTLFNSNESRNFMNFAAFNGFKAVQRYNRGTLADEIFGRAGIKIVTTSAAAELDVEGVQIIASGKTSRTVIGTVKSGAPNSIREPSLLAIDNFFFRGGVELNHQLYFFHSFTKFPPLDQVIQILTKETDFKLLELKMSDAYQNVSQNMIVLRGLSENNNKGMLGKEHFLELSGITMLGGVNLH